MAARVRADVRELERDAAPRPCGGLVLCDAEDGRPLAVMDSMEVTLRRTAAAISGFASGISSAIAVAESYNWSRCASSRKIRRL